MQSLEVAEQAQAVSKQLSEQESHAKREAESALGNQIVQLQKELEAKVHSILQIFHTCFIEHTNGQVATEQKAKVTIDALEQDKKDRDTLINEHKREIESLTAKVCVYNNTYIQLQNFSLHGYIQYCYANQQILEAQQRLSTTSEELQQLRQVTKDQKKEAATLQASLESQQRETARLKTELQEAMKSLDEVAKAKESERVHQDMNELLCFSCLKFMQIELEARVGSLQTQLHSTEHNLRTTEESLACNKSALEKELSQTQKHLKTIKSESERSKVCLTP